MTDELAFDLEWEGLAEGAAEERATFAAIGLRCDGAWFTEAEDAFARRLRSKVHLSGYRLAEWLAWNWWRLRWEPKKASLDWAMAHRLSTIGDGYLWPNITIASDGLRVALLSDPTAPDPSEPLRYLGREPMVVTAEAYEAAVEALLERVVAQLRAEGLADSNGERIWRQVCEERADPQSCRWRRLEALLGIDPDEGDAGQIEGLLRLSQELGETGVEEFAAAGLAGSLLAVDDIVAAGGFGSRPANAACLGQGSLLTAVEAAWWLGSIAARVLRGQEHLGAGPLGNRRLAALAAVDEEVLGAQGAAAPVAFALDREAGRSAVVLRSRYETGRLFELARLLGDRILSPEGGPLKPATRSFTYRQKAQRAFAAELLCPFEALTAFLDGDFSEDAIRRAAEYYEVSDYTVRTLLTNNRLLDRADLMERLEAA